jgi:hypothetical protein
MHAIRFQKLAPLVNVPRPLSPALEQITGKPFFFLPWAVSSWKERMQHAPLVAAAVVQTNGALYSRETASFSPAVLCFSIAHGLSEQAARQLAAMLVAIRDGEMPDPSGGRVRANLSDHASSFFEALPELGHGAFWATTYVDPERLPDGCLPADGVLPALVHPPESYIELVPASLWT